jgi:cellulose synthase/poly-beta-1,6-N-acetylglucosamine synthase-like glycosyltransferase
MLSQENLTRLHLGGIFAFAIITMSLYIGLIDWSISNIYFITIWTILFGILSINLGYCLMCAIVSQLRQSKNIPEIDLESLNSQPSVAIIYCVKNETGPLQETMQVSFENNFGPYTDLFLLSNSIDKEVQKKELKLVEDLQYYFGTDKVKYSSQQPPKHRGLRNWLHENPHYDYVMICDADSFLPAGSVKALVAKAEHPDNIRVGIFQSRLHVRSTFSTIFGWLVGPGQNICQKIYTKANGTMFTNDVFYGSGALLRSSAFKKLNLPADILSHDIWDTTILDTYGYKTKFCYDVITYECFPNNYLELVKRESRWFTGCIQSLQLLKVKGLSLANKAQIIHPVYNYFSQLVFAIWLFLGVVNHMSYTILQNGFLYYNSKLGELLLYTFVMGIIIGHRFVSARSFNDVILAFREVVGSSCLYLNGVIYTSYVVLFRRGMINTKNWVPTAKNQVNLTWRETILALWPTTILGILMLIALIFYKQLWILTATPFLISFAFGIPITYYTSRSMTPFFGKPKNPSQNRFRQFTFTFSGFASVVSSIGIVIVLFSILNIGFLSKIAVRAAIQLGVNCPASVTIGKTYDCTFSVPGETFFPLLGTRYKDVVPLLHYYINTEQRVNGQSMINFSSQSQRCKLNNTTGANIEIICRNIPTNSLVGTLKPGWADINVGIIAPTNLTPNLVADTTIGWFKIEEIKLKE